MHRRVVWSTPKAPEHARHVEKKRQVSILSFSCEDWAHFRYSRKWQRRVLERKSVSTPHTKHKKMHPEHRRSRFKPRPVCDLEARGCFKHRTCALGQIRRCTGTMFGACLKLENTTGTSFEVILLSGRLLGWLADGSAGWLAGWRVGSQRPPLRTPN